MSAIPDAVEFLRREVERNLGPGVDVTADSARKLQAEDVNGIYISLINLEEERVLRNTPHVERISNKANYVEPPLYLNLYLLLAFKLANYATSLTHLDSTIELFQHRRWFSAETQNAIGATPFPASLEKLVCEMVNMDMEELNNLWGVLGDAYFPSVVYRVRMLRIQRNATALAPEVKTIEIRQVIE